MPINHIAARTNSVKVKDIGALVADIKGIPIKVIREESQEDQVYFTPLIENSLFFDHLKKPASGRQKRWTWSDICRKHLCSGEELVAVSIVRAQDNYLTVVLDGADAESDTDKIIGIARITTEGFWHLFASLNSHEPKQVSWNDFGSVSSDKGKSVNVGDTVWVLVYDHRHGTSVETFTTKDAAEKARIDLAMEYWDSEIPSRIHKPTNPEELAAVYFDYMADHSEYCSIHETTLRAPQDISSLDHAVVK